MPKLTAEVFKTDIEISPNINVLVGFNGTGKTRILKKIETLKEYKSSTIDNFPCIFPSLYPKVLEELNKYFIKIDKEIIIINDYLYYKINDLTLSINTLSKNENYLINLFYQVNKLSEVSDILLIEEVEKGLHLAWQEMILDSFSVIAPDTQFFITTHSPSILMKGHFNSFINVKDLKNFIE